MGPLFWLGPEKRARKSRDNITSRLRVKCDAYSSILRDRRKIWASYKKQDENCERERSSAEFFGTASSGNGTVPGFRNELTRGKLRLWRRFFTSFRGHYRGRGAQDTRKKCFISFHLSCLEFLDDRKVLTTSHEKRDSRSSRRDATIQETRGREEIERRISTLLSQGDSVIVRSDPGKFQFHGARK